jgi:phosphocarrier protein HPr
VMMLAASKGSKIIVEASGADEAEALESLLVLINNRFGEAE